jgi:2-oxoisovalerate dehydrogenase E1 component alpha subunit
VETKAVDESSASDYTLAGLVGSERALDWVPANGKPYGVLDDEVDDGLPPGLSAEQLRAMYEEMLLARAVDARAVSLQRQGRIAFCVTSTGEEAAIVGSAWALTPDDWVFSAYREIAVALHRGVTLETFFSQAFGNEHDILKGRQMPNHFGSADVHFTVASSPVGTQIPQAAGAAYAMALRGERNAVITYFGDGATSTGDFHAGMNFAGVQRLPVVFFCKNNGWAISLPAERQTASATLAQKAVAYGFEGVRVDGNDILAVYEVTRRAMEKARGGGGPTMIEAVTFRMGPHSSADDPTRYRSDELLTEWGNRDPINRFRAYLERRGIWTPEDDERARQEVDERIAAAVSSAERYPPPPAASMFEDVYHDLPWHLREECNAIVGEEG